MLISSTASSAGQIVEILERKVFSYIAARRRLLSQRDGRG